MRGMKTLYDDTIALLKSTRLSRREIAAGAGLGFDWLNKLAQGHIEDPGIKRIQRLHDFLSRKRAA